MKIGTISFEMGFERPSLLGVPVTGLRFVAEARAGRRTALLLSGCRLTVRGTQVRKCDLYDAVAQMGMEPDAIASLIDSCSIPRLFADRSLLVLDRWFATDLKQAADLVSFLARHLKAATVAIECSGNSPEPPEADASARRQIAYRESLTQAHARAQAMSRCINLPAARRLLYAQQRPRLVRQEHLERRFPRGTLPPAVDLADPALPVTIVTDFVNFKQLIIPNPPPPRRVVSLVRRSGWRLSGSLQLHGQVYQRAPHLLVLRNGTVALLRMTPPSKAMPFPTGVPIRMVRADDLPAVRALVA